MRQYPVCMANRKHTTHVGITILGLIVGALLAVATGDPTVPLMLSTGVMSGVGYWIGATTQRRHG